MKSVKKLLIIALVVAIVAPLLNSCKKGEEDPWFSFYSRKTRLCQAWKFSFYKRVEQHNATIVSYTYDGSSFRKISSNDQYISAGSMVITFSTNGTYKWEQQTTTDTSTYNYSEQGNWYFSGKNSDGETKSKELLSLQKKDMTETSTSNNSISTITYKGSGDLGTNVFKIVGLSSKEVHLISEYQITNTTGGGDDIVKITTEIKLQKNL
ncbi:MAG: hypothetical protein WCM76_10665 [Bacteroidota bacterium]